MVDTISFLAVVAWVMVPVSVSICYWFVGLFIEHFLLESWFGMDTFKNLTIRYQYQCNGMVS